MSYKQYYPHLYHYMKDRSYEDFHKFWFKHLEKDIAMLASDVTHMGCIWFDCLFSGNLRVLAFLLKHPRAEQFLKYKVLGIMDSPTFSPDTSYLPLDILFGGHETETGNYNRKAALRLLLYCRGVEIFQNTKAFDQSAEWFYTSGQLVSATFKDGETIGNFMKRACTNLLEQNQLLTNINQAIRQNNHIQLNQNFESLIELLRTYAEGDEGLNYFYEEELFSICEKIILPAIGSNRALKINFFDQSMPKIQCYLRETTPYIIEFKKFLKAVLQNPCKSFTLSEDRARADSGYHGNEHSLLLGKKLHCE